MALWEIGNNLFQSLENQGHPLATAPASNAARRHLMLNSIPEIHHVSVEKYYRGLYEVPPDYKQTDAEEVKLVDDIDVIFSVDPDVYYHRRHAMIVGHAGCGKSTFLERIIDKLNNHIIRYMVFPIDLEDYTGDEVVNATDFLFHRRGGAELKVLGDTFSAMVASSEKLMFVLNDLDRMPADFEAECEEITERARTTTRVIIHNLLIGRIFPKCKIISSCRHYRVKNFQGKLAPDEIFTIGELTDEKVTELSLLVFSPSASTQILSIMKLQSPTLSILSRTPAYLVYGLISAGNGEPYQFDRTVSMLVMEVLATVVKLDKSSNKHTVKIIQKLKELAYFGFKKHKFRFEKGLLEKRFNLTMKEVKSLSFTMPGKNPDGPKFSTMKISGDFVSFVDLHVQEFVCALRIVDEEMSEYQDFLKNDIHKPKNHNLRRMVCGLILNQNVQHPCVREGIMKATNEMKQKKSSLLSSMRAEFYKVKRRDLLEFMHAAREGGEGGFEILPRNVDTIDFSHIQLFLADSLAISAALSGNIRIDCLNLSNCNLSINGISVLRTKILKAKTRIRCLILDFCDDWAQNAIGIESLCDLMRACEVKELSLNNMVFYPGALQILTVGLRNLKVKTFHFKNVVGLNDQGYALLGDFIIRHDVEDLYITGKDITDRQIRKLSHGLREFKVREKKPVDDSTLYIGRLDLDSD